MQKIRKNKIKVLLLENIDLEAEKFFIQKGYEVKNLVQALNEEELIGALKGVSILGIRSKTKVTKKVLENAPDLRAVGAFCIGTDQIDLLACGHYGVSVFNAPYSSTRSVVELALGEMIMLLRKVFDKSVNLHKKVWNKSSEGSFEVRGKSLGIIGYGNIGSHLSFMAEFMGMQVYYFDIADRPALGSAKKCDSMEELLRKSDIVTLHIDARAENHNLIGEKEFKIMRKGSYFLNLSRGKVVNLEALAHSLKSGHLAGAAVDVFPEEPKSNNEKVVNVLQKLPNVILTPHIGGSTEEAQKHIAQFVSNRLFKFMNSKNNNLSNSLSFTVETRTII
ncbi:MAG: phosphoglycerate dehydrogenase [Patescibacteria group bacterium]